MKTKIIYVVFYNEFPVMKEKQFEDKVAADTFAAEKGSTAIELKIKK